MNCRLYQPRIGPFPEASSFASRLRLTCLLNVLVAVFAGFIFIEATWSLKAADDTITNTATGAMTNQSLSQISAPGVTNQVNVLDDKYHLAIGDQLSFRIVEDEDDPKILTVMDSGELEVPYVGRFPAAGKSCKELAQELKVELEKKDYLQATVIIAVDSKPRSRGKVYLAGAIGSPGAMDISGDEVLTVSRAILRAGGLSSFANGKDVQITRTAGLKPGHEKKYTVNVSRVIEDGKTGDDLPLEPGDFIYVPERLIRF